MSREPGLPQPGDVVGGKYRVDCAIGTGGMGAVYRATHALTGRAVALKWLRPKLAAEPRAAQRFIREARASARIRHPNVVDIYGVEEQDGQAFLVFELLEGETLRELLRQRRLGIGECLALLVPAMRGAAAAHAQGVVHRDIKPENVFLVRDPDDPLRRIPKVLDFGISKLVAETPQLEGTLTATGVMLGTPHYMSLEQLQAAEVDARSDVYAFGVVLYECLTGRRPYESENFSAIVVKVATETPADPRALRPDLPRALCDVVLKAMARQRDDRYPSMHALIDALAPFMTGVASGPPLPPPGPPAPPGAPSPGEATHTSGREHEREHEHEHEHEHEVDPARRISRARWAVAGFGVLAASAVAGWVGWSRVPSAPPEQPEAPAQQASASDKQPPANESQPARSNPTNVSTDTPAAVGADTQPPPRAAQDHAFTSGWVYLGNYADGRWQTRYFDGFGGGLPARGARLTPRGRSYVRMAMPDARGELSVVRTTIGPETRVELLELAYWEGGSYVWARVRPVK